MIPLWGLIIELPVDVRQLVAVASGLALALNTAVCLALKLKWFYYSCRYVYLLVRHMYRIYGLQLLVEDTWKRIRFPDVLRVFWLTRMTVQAIILVYVVKVVRHESGDHSYLTWDVFWDLFSNLIISGCDSMLTVLGMSAVISSIAHYLGLSILAFIGSTEEEDKRLGFVAPVLHPGPANGPEWSGPRGTAGTAQPQHVPSADCHPALHPWHDGPCAHVAECLSRLLLPPPLSGSAGVALSLCAACCA
jgi:E3 ubiquitin-protein ligase RNF139